MGLITLNHPMMSGIGVPFSPYLKSSRHHCFNVYLCLTSEPLTWISDLNIHNPFLKSEKNRYHDQHQCHHLVKIVKIDFGVLSFAKFHCVFLRPLWTYNHHDCLSREMELTHFIDTILNHWLITVSGSLLDI